MNNIRLATKEEVETLRTNSDLDIGSTVFAWDKHDSVPDFAVIRQCTEVDPVKFSSSTDNRRKTLFIWGLEHMLKGAGVPFYYFNVDAADTQWQGVIRTWGAKETSPTPEIRFKKILT